MDVELEHGLHDQTTNVTGDDPVITGKIALAHLNEFPDYYTRLERMEEEAKRDHGREEVRHFRRESNRLDPLKTCRGELGGVRTDEFSDWPRSDRHGYTGRPPR